MMMMPDFQRTDTIKNRDNATTEINENPSSTRAIDDAIEINLANILKSTRLSKKSPDTEKKRKSTNHLRKKK